MPLGVVLLRLLANKFTHISPTTAAAVHEELGTQVDLILEGGECEVGLESTIIDMRGDEPVILRPGMISSQAIAAVLGTQVNSSRQDSPAPRAPGMHHLHYAPTTKTVLINAENISTTFKQWKEEAFASGNRCPRYFVHACSKRYSLGQHAY